MRRRRRDEASEFRGGREPDEVEVEVELEDDQGPSDWTDEKPSDVLLAVGLLRLNIRDLLARRGRDE